MGQRKKSGTFGDGKNSQRVQFRPNLALRYLATTSKGYAAIGGAGSVGWWFFDGFRQRASLCGGGSNASHSSQGFRGGSGEAAFEQPLAQSMHATSKRGKGADLRRELRRRIPPRPLRCPRHPVGFKCRLTGLAWPVACDDHGNLAWRPCRRMGWLPLRRVSKAELRRGGDEQKKDGESP